MMAMRTYMIMKVMVLIFFNFDGDMNEVKARVMLIMILTTMSRRMRIKLISGRRRQDEKLM